MSSAAASASVAPSQPGCAANLYEIPVTAAACAMPFGGNHTDIMSSCCGSTQVVSYYNDCGLFCLAQGQSVGDLTDCLYSNGASYQDVFCNDKTTATATGGPISVAASAHASVVTGGSSGASPTEGLSSPTSSSPEPSSSGSSATSNGLTCGSLLKGAGLIVVLLAPVWYA